jgi:hypothetical protein
MSHERSKILPVHMCHARMSLLVLKTADLKSIVAVENAAQDLVKLPELGRVDKQGTISLNERPQSAFVIKGLARHDECRPALFASPEVCRAQGLMVVYYSVHGKQEEFHEDRWDLVTSKLTCSMTG